MITTALADASRLRRNLLQTMDLFLRTPNGETPGRTFTASTLDLDTLVTARPTKRTPGFSASS
jgi:hypothetical protein